MHTLTLSSVAETGIPIMGGREILPGHTYLMSDSLTGSLLTSRHPVKVGEDERFANRYITVKRQEIMEFDPNEDWNGRTIWIMRGGGYGDLLLLTPTIRELKARWPKVKIKMGIGGQYHGLYYGIDVEEVHCQIDVEEIKDGDHIFFYENFVEDNPLATKIHMADLFASHFKIELTDRHPDYFVSPEEEKWARDNFGRNPTSTLPRIGIQFMASCILRTYTRVGAVVNILAKKRTEQFMFGLPGQIKMEGELPGFTNLMECDPPVTFRQSAAILATCDVCIAPDSAMVHLSSALRIPCVALYGPFPGLLRVTGEVEILQGTAPCAPCMYHCVRADEFPEGMPCSKLPRETRHCIAMDTYSAEFIAIKALSFAKPRLILPR